MRTGTTAEDIMQKCPHCHTTLDRFTFKGGWMPQVLKRKGLYGTIPEGAVYVGRPSRYGNPFKIGVGGVRTREDAIRLHEEYARERLEREPDWLEPLRGKDLVCYCAPLPCHADVLLRLANQ